VIYPRIGPEVLVYRAEAATCAFFRRGGGPGTAQDDLVVSWSHTGKDGAVHLEVPTNARYIIMLGNTTSWWKTATTCDSADALTVGQTDVDLDVPWVK